MMKLLCLFILISDVGALRIAVPGVIGNDLELESLLPFSTAKAVDDHHFVHRIKHHVERGHLKVKRVPDELMHSSDIKDEDRIWGLRPGATFTWEQQNQALKNAGRQFCLLVRDNWSCSGQKYEEMLKKSAPLDSRWRLENWPQGTRFFGEGHSFFAQKIYTILCESNASVWKFENGNSLFAYSSTSDASIFLLDNDPYWNNNTTKTIALLKDIEYEPHVISLGSLNNGTTRDGGIQYTWGEPASDEKRLQTYGQAFKSAVTVPHFGLRLQANCRANHCEQREGHQCIPGPISDDAGQFAMEVLQTLIQ
eukprot:gnl/MRDRNA2_/MRDRNA2_111493_c0_seq1.p1 gnl/MRDRNA2_/MRDRNA2_111493_c0~~gnl/MRDRNA2_/MRDRNA2_111493_c0_seq1.p1  ORF type:complete len:309 (+),score=35.09 gnl/MRDRNA2_/MRDRNA2_111493_c0_seq1:72-998(+)